MDTSKGSRFESIKQHSDVVALLKLIRDIAFNIEADCNPFMAQVAAIKNYVNIKQGFTTPNDTYYNNFINNQEVLEHAGVDLAANETLLAIIMKERGFDPDTIGLTEKATVTA